MSPDCSEIEAIVAERLKLGAVSVEDLICELSQKGVLNARRTAKEIAWSWAEDGRARFNNEWLLELIPSYNNASN